MSPKTSLARGRGGGVVRLGRLVRDLARRVLGLGGGDSRLVLGDLVHLARLLGGGVVGLRRLGLHLFAKHLGLLDRCRAVRLGLVQRLDRDRLGLVVGVRRVVRAPLGKVGGAGGQGLEGGPDAWEGRERE